MSKIRKVLLLNPPGKRLYLRDAYCASFAKANFYWPQIDLLIQSGFLSQHFDIYVLDATILGLNEAETLQTISSIKPDAVFCLASSISWDEDKKIMETIKHKNNSVIVGGGDIFSFDGLQVFNNNPFLDGILLDFSSDAFLDYLLGEHDGIISNMIYRRDGKLYEGKHQTSSYPLKYPIPRHELFPLKKYRVPFFSNGKIFSVVYSSHGCPFSCSFCSAIEFNFLRLREIENLLAELRYINSLGINNIYFRDALFTADKKHSVEICEAMIKEGFNFEWYCESRVDTIDLTLADAMRRAGCSLIRFGVESGDDGILKFVNKGIDSSMIKKAFEYCRHTDIRTTANIIFGLPGETEETVLKTIQFVMELDCDYVSFNIAMPKLGTELRRKALNEGWISSDIREISNGIPLPTIPLERLKRLRNYAVKKFYLRPRYIFNHLRSIHSGRNLIRSFQMLASLFNEMRKD